MNYAIEKIYKILAIAEGNNILIMHTSTIREEAPTSIGGSIS